MQWINQQIRYMQIISNELQIQLVVFVSNLNNHMLWSFWRGMRGSNPLQILDRDLSYQWTNAPELKNTVFCVFVNFFKADTVI